MAVWQEIASALASIANTWWEQSQDVRAGVSHFRSQLFKPIPTKLGFEYRHSDDPDTTELRTTAHSVLADSDDAETLAEYQKRFAIFVSKCDESAIPNDLRNSIYAHCVRVGSEVEYAKVLDVYRNPPTAAHEEAAIRALCYPEKSDLIARTLGMLLTDQVKSSVRRFLRANLSPLRAAPDRCYRRSSIQNLIQFYSALASNRVARRPLWKHFQQNFELIVSQFSGG